MTIDRSSVSSLTIWLTLTLLPQIRIHGIDRREEQWFLLELVESPFSPLCLLLVPGAIALLRGRAPSRFHAGVRAVVAAGAVLALFLQLPAGAQVQAAWLALLVPLHLALAFPVRRA